MRTVLAACWWLVVVGAAALPGQNSTRKVRVPPGEVAARVGTAVAWQETVAGALVAARAQQKLVFWYVGAVAGTPMDRQAEIDRYQRGGPFSWPSTVALLGQHFVCTDEVPKGELQQRYQLVRQRFIEPGYLVLSAEGEVLLAVAEITTLHPEWYEAPLRRLVGQPSEGLPVPPQLRQAWQHYREGDCQAAAAAAAAVLAAGPGDLLAAEVGAAALWLAGVARWRAGDRSAAQDQWRQLQQLFPDHCLAWKAALECEGHGPFVRGFEDYLPLPAAALAQPPTHGSRLVGVYDEATLWQRSIGFLLGMHEDGVFRDSAYDFGGTDSLPNVHAAVTCLAGMVLLAAESRAAPAQRPALERLLVRIREHAEATHWLALSDQDEILWARAYALRFLVAWHRQRPADRDALQPALRSAAGALLALQPETGVWFHEYGNPFAIATALQGLHEAQQVGIEVDAQKVLRGRLALAQNRTPQGAFTYSHTRRGQPRASLEAAAGRMPLCEMGLFLWGDSDQQKLAAAVEAGFRHHSLLAAVRKYDDHADRHGYGGFFFWFDMLGRAEAAALLADTDLRQRQLGELRQLVLDLPEFDGVFVDSHELGRVYGTAMALLCLDRAAAAR